MRVLHSVDELSGVPGPHCIAIGAFDGIHLGHQALIGQMLSRARTLRATPVVLTFDPHPSRILRPDHAPRLLTSTPHKLRLIESLGCPNILLIPFNAAFAAQDPEVFVVDLARHGLALVCVGRDWAFGRNRSGNVALLRQLGAKLGFETLEIPPVSVGTEMVSSTRIRRAVEEGDFDTAKLLLGRDYTILGTVEHGANLGERIGFPTANLSAHNEQFPPNGVYAVRVLRQSRWLDGVANIGVRPTVDQAGQRKLEVHIFDFTEDCYGEDVEVRFEHFLRPEKKFDSLDELVAQIRSDSAQARELLACHP